MRADDEKPRESPAPESHRARARFVERATLVAGLCGFAFGVIVLPLLLRPEAPHTTAIFAAGVFASILCAAGYVAVARGRQDVAVWCVVVAATAGPIIAAPSSPLILGFIPTAVGIASLTLSARATAAVGLASFILPVAATTWLPEWELYSAVVLGSANVTTSGMILVIRGWNVRLRETALARFQAEAALTEQLREARRLEAVGQLAGGVAHDLNNYMTVILCSLELADPEGEDRLLTEVRGAAERSAKVVAQLLAYARQQPRHPEALDAAAVLRDLEGLLRSLIRDDVTLTVRVPQAAWVKADRTQLEQVMVNLVANANHAVPAGTGRIDVDVTCAGEDVRIDVEDNGGGIAPDVEARMFEPFFTTRGQIGGTGLGLATVHAIVEQSAGRIEVKSTPGKGTRFRVVLPADEPAAAPVRERARDVSKRTGTILLVDDHDGVRRALARRLRGRGHEVTEADGPASAFPLFDEKHFDLVITDVVMPGMSGPAFADELRRRRPVPILFASGFVAGAEVPSELLIPKPIDAQVLYARVDELLAEAELRTNIA